MSKHNTSRRAVLTGAAGVAAAGVLSTAALALPAHHQGLSPSPDAALWEDLRSKDAAE